MSEPKSYGVTTREQHDVPIFVLSCFITFARTRIRLVCVSVVISPFFRKLSRKRVRLYFACALLLKTFISSYRRLVQRCPFCRILRLTCHFRFCAEFAGGEPREVVWWVLRLFARAGSCSGCFCSWLSFGGCHSSLATLTEILY